MTESRQRMSAEERPIIVGISGASGTIYGVELLRALAEQSIPAWAVVSQAAEKVLAIEHGLTFEDVLDLAERVYRPDEIAAPPASGSFRSRGMVVAPCSIRTLSAIANSLTDNLLTRSADVCLKEGRKLVLMVRETPFHLGHLELMTRAARLGAVILPPIPAFYHRPASIDDLIAQVVGKVLDQFEIEHDLFPRWGGPEEWV